MRIFQILFRMLYRPKCKVCKRPVTAEEIKRAQLCNRCAAREHARQSSGSQTGKT